MLWLKVYKVSSKAEITQHNRGLEVLLTQFKEEGINLNTDKCKTRKLKVDFLGNQLSKEETISNNLQT